jgi:hypothetical protein
MSGEFDVKDIRTGAANGVCPTTLFDHLTPLSYASGTGSLSALVEMKEWPKSADWKLSGNPDTFVNLHDLSDGQVAWLEGNFTFWVVQKSGNLFYWYHLLTVSRQEDNTGLVPA